MTTFAVVGAADLIDHSCPGTKSGASPLIVSVLPANATDAIIKNASNPVLSIDAPDTSDTN
jgi:hypothetical protein